MKPRMWSAGAVLFLAASVLTACQLPPAQGQLPPSGASGAQRSAPMDAGVRDVVSDVVAPRQARLEPFGSEAAFLEFGGALQRAETRRQENQRHHRNDSDFKNEPAEQRNAQDPDAGVRRRSPARSVDFAPESPAPAAAAPTAQATASTNGTTATSITNNQEQGVDEGDIVKVRGNDLLILRRGRLFSVRMEQGRLVPRSVVSVAPPGLRPASWYDEMLVDGDTVLVLGFGYERRATEVNRFRIDENGMLSYRDSILLRSGDYYSARNYASRIVGHRLVLYTPVPLLQYDYDPQTRQGRQVLAQPAVRTLNGPWQNVADWSQVYRPVRHMGYQPLVHTVHVCDLSTPTFQCRSRGAVGPHARTFYVSRRAVYLWVTSQPRDPDPMQDTNERFYSSFDPSNTGSVVYRFPFDEGPVHAVLATGGPTDQFSFREQNEQLQVLVRAESEGDGMWGTEFSAGAVGLYQIPLSMFSRDVPAVPSTALRHLPHPGPGYMFQNRFVGDYVLWGLGQTWWRANQNSTQHRVFAHHIARERTDTLPLTHGVDRIEPMARDAVVVGSDGRNLHFRAVALDEQSRLAGHFERPNAAQGETRSHGFFYLPTGDRTGMLGLPLRRENEHGYRQLFEGSAEVLFLKVNTLQFRELGALRAVAPRRNFNDSCIASCVDWYGNARPIFYRGRILALLGYELVEGTITNERLLEQSRVNYLEVLRPSLPTPRVQ